MEDSLGCGAGPCFPVYWVRLGNCLTADIARLVERRAGIIREFRHGEARLLILNAGSATSLLSPAPLGCGSAPAPKARPISGGAVADLFNG